MSSDVPKKEIPEGVVDADEQGLSEQTRNDAPDSMAEAALFNSGKSAKEIMAESAANEAQRQEEFKAHIEQWFRRGVSTAAITLLALFVVWALHLVFPESWKWLSHEAIEKIQTIITGGAIAGIATDHLRKRMN